ncbi:MAG TPA: MerC domain-containing protein [Thermoanaerobaculia bacterium]
MTSNALLRLADRFGCSLSAACAVHCLVTPLFVTFLSISPLAEEAELPMIVVALALAAITFSAGFVRNTALLPLTLLVIAGPLMIASRCVEHPWLETSLLVAGAVLLSIGHIVNLRRGHDCSATGKCGEVA